jgi:alanine racemase
MVHTSYIEISNKAYHNNIRFLKSQIGEKVTISSVVKGNAYGHGIENTVKIAEKVGIRHFSTFSTDEAIRVLQSSTKTVKL